MNVLIRLEDLESRARAACLDFGGPVAAESLRMLCCDAAVVPIVMNGKGRPLDVGRITRVVPEGSGEPSRRGTAAAPTPAAAVPVSGRHCHHIEPWNAAGTQASTNLVMLCAAHHRQIHSTNWAVRIRDGLPEFIPPMWIDPTTST